MFFETTEKGLLIRIRLTPKAAHNEIDETIVDEKGVSWLKVKVTAVPEDGKANKALIILLSKTWKIPKSAFEFLQGETDRHKTFLIKDLDLIEIFYKKLAKN